MLQAQPIMDLATGEIHQYEMLLRMRDPLGELISPAAFLPVAERYDLIGAIDKWVVRQAIRDARRGARAQEPARLRGQHLRPLDRRPGAAGADRARARGSTASPPSRSSSRSPRPPPSATSRARRSSPPTSTSSAAASRSTTSAPPSRASTTSSTCRSTTSRSTASSCAPASNDRTDQLVIQAVVDIARGLGKRTVAEMVGDQPTLDLLAALGRRPRAGLPHRQARAAGEVARRGEAQEASGPPRAPLTAGIAARREGARPARLARLGDRRRRARRRDRRRGCWCCSGVTHDDRARARRPARREGARAADLRGRRRAA